MVLKAIMDQLATGSIANVYTRGNMEGYPGGKDSDEMLEPYVLVFDDFAVDAYYTTSNTIRPLMVDVHYPPGYIDELNKYVEEEIIELLNRKRLTDSEGYVFQVYVTADMGIMVEPNDDRTISGGNDDRTISRYRRIFVPRRTR
jgi:hypothetical protein